MLNDLKHLGLPRRRTRLDWLLGIAAGVAFLGLVSWMSNRDAGQQTHIAQLVATCHETTTQERTP